MTISFMKLAHKLCGIGLCCFVVLPVFGKEKAANLSVKMKEIKRVGYVGGMLTFLSDGRTLVCQNNQGRNELSKIEYWDSKTIKLKSIVATPKLLDYPLAFAFSPDKKVFVTAYSDQLTGHIRLWDAQTGKLKRTLIEAYHTSDGQPRGLGPVWALAYSPNGKTLAVGLIYEGEESTGGEVLLIDAFTGKTKSKLHMPDHGVTALAFSAGGRLVAAACDDSRVRLCSVKTGRLISTTKITDRHDEFRVVALSPDSKRIVVATKSQLVRIYSARTGALIRTFTKVGGDFYGSEHSVALSKDAKTVAVSGYEKSGISTSPIITPVIRLVRLNY